MPKRLVLIFVGFVILASLIFYGFNRWKASQEKVDLWTLVPEDAALVVETNNHQQLLEHLRETNLWESVAMLPATASLSDNLTYLDSVAPGNQRLDRFLNEKHILTSLHVEGGAETRFVFYVPVNSVGELRFMRTLAENINKSDTYEQRTRDYQGHLLTSVANKRNGSSFTYFTFHNNIILSSSPALVEEIVRRASRGAPASVAADFSNVNYLSQPDVYANVFVNYRALPDLLGLFLEKDLMPQVRYLSSLCQSGMLELKLRQNRIFLNGFSVPERLKNSLHNTMQPQKPQPLGIRGYLPNNTAMMLHFGLQDVSKLRQGQGATLALADSLSRGLSKEAAVVYLESNSIAQSPEKLIYTHTVNPARTQRLLSNLAASQQEKPYIEKYGKYTIQLLDVPNLPEQLLGRVFKGFEQTYAVQLDDYLVMAEEAATLRHLLDDIAKGETWSESGVQKAFLEEAQHEANLSFFLSNANAWYLLNRYTREDEREDLLQNATLIKRFAQVGLQFSLVENDGRYYTSLVIRRPDQIKPDSQDGFEEVESIALNNRIDTQPFPVQNAVTRAREVVVQDSANVLINITDQGRRGWSDSLSTALRSDIRQIEYGADKKLRYLFITANRIHAINNQGAPLVNFPFNLPDTVDLQHLAVFDYEKDGNYRLLVDDSFGNLYMFNMQGAAVQGWQPRRMDYRLSASPQHVRVGGQDVVLVSLQNGYIYALSRTGDTYPGFPIDLKVPLTSGLTIKAGADLRRTEVTAVTRYGNVITFNLQGRVLQQQQLHRPSKRAMFDLVPESSNGRSAVIVRQEMGKVAIFDQDLKELFEKRYVTSAPKIVQYFRFGSVNRIYAITETGPGKTYLYDANGRLIGGRSLETNNPVTIYYNDITHDYTLYYTSGKELKKLRFRVGE